jgi:integrase/recombinase XerD
MIEDFFPNPIVLHRLHAGPFGAHIDAIAQELSDHGFAVATARYAMRLLAALSTWLQGRGLAVSQLNETIVDAFLRHRYRSHRKSLEDHPTLTRLLVHLRDAAVIPPLVRGVESDEYAGIKEAFQAHLIGQRNLASSTVRSYLDTVGRFLG